jgi:hypothetical protein
MRRFIAAILLCLILLCLTPPAAFAADVSEREIRVGMKKAAEFYHDQVASHGGYVYFYSLDLSTRWGEGLASKEQVWIQPPGTPTVGLAFLAAYHATSDEFYLDAATDAALAVAHGQLKSGGWTNCVDFDPRGARTADYRNRKGRGKNNSSLDDGQTQSAIRLLIHVDKAHSFRHTQIHEAAEVGLKALLDAQFPNGGFPQVWTGPTVKQPVLKANYPKYDWRTEGRIKEYWTMYTLNDNVCGYVAETLIDAHKIYDDGRYLSALKKLGDFLILAQMPEPQPAWAQQYNYQMNPIWARKFEPAGIAGHESQGVIETLLQISIVTDDLKYIEPIPAALAYLRRSLLPDGKVARFYEMQSNKPIYIFRRGKSYDVTYKPSNMSTYGWTWDSRIADLQAKYEARKEGLIVAEKRDAIATAEILATLDSQGRWVSTYKGERLVGQAKMAVGERYLSSEVFSQHLTTLSADLGAKPR